MEVLRKVLLSIFGLFLSIATTIIVMIKGWGLEPQNWWWIIGVYLFGQIFAQLIVESAKTNDKKRK